jgi:short-subunit dehydrogenase
MQGLPNDVIREHGHVHILVNNAGVSVIGTVEEQSIDDFEWIVGINLWGVIYGCKFFLPYLEREEESHIVNLSSLFGIIGVPTQSSYNATKFAIRGFSEALHAELTGTSVGLSVVHPGVIHTNIVQASRMAPQRRRSRLQKRFDRYAMAPERAAAKIVRAIEKNQHRVRIGRETYLLDWAKRLFPVLTQKAIATGYERGKKHS